MNKPGTKDDPIVGKKFGMLKVMQRLKDRITGAKNVRAQILVQCDCGLRKQMTRYYILRKPNPVTHCGCQKRQVTSYKYNPEYKVWAQMKARCYNEAHRSYKDYGGRGIRVCVEWLDSFEAFFRDMSTRPSPEYTLDRRDPNGNYEKNNCRWATPTEQAGNKRKHWAIRNKAVKNLKLFPTTGGIPPKTE